MLILAISSGIYLVLDWHGLAALQTRDITSLAHGVERPGFKYDSRQGGGKTQNHVTDLHLDATFARPYLSMKNGVMVRISHPSIWIVIHS